MGSASSAGLGGWGPGKDQGNYVIPKFRELTKGTEENLTRRHFRRGEQEDADVHIF